MPTATQPPPADVTAGAARLASAFRVAHARDLRDAAWKAIEAERGVDEALSAWRDAFRALSPCEKAAV